MFAEYIQAALERAQYKVIDRLKNRYMGQLLAAMPNLARYRSCNM